MSILLPKYKKFKQERRIGEYTIHLPDPPSIEKMANYNLPKEQQKFIPTIVPKDIHSWDERSREEFESEQWNRRINGYWFMNNGNIEYITGTNYFYINDWHIDIGLPSFIDSDQDLFYLWKHVEDNPKARGLVYMCRRRSGKTWKGTCIVYEDISRTPNSLGSIQSKSNADAEKVFDKLIFAWRRLSYYHKPIDAGISHPKSELEFSEPSVRNTKNQSKKYSKVLDSVIDYANAKEEALDGTKQRRHFCDEAGKFIDGDADVRMNIVKECVMDGTRIVGKIFCSSTVEEFEKKGGKQFKKIWDKADLNNLMPNGETEQGMLRFLQEAYKGLAGTDEKGKPFVDEYGYSDETRANEYLDRRLKSIKRAEDISSERRKYPRSVKDCFIQDSKMSVFDTTRIEQQLDYNQTLPNNILVRGDFQWQNGIKDTAVEWVPRKDGLWLMSWLPRYERWNKRVMKYGRVAPGNVEDGCLGLDPYDNKVTADNRKSDAACYGFRRFDPMCPNESGMFFLEYVARPRLPEMMWESMIMASVFLGYEILIESNKIGTINYFRMRGYENYLMERPSETETAFSSGIKEAERGIPLSGEEARLSLIYATQSYIGNHVGLVEEEGKEPYMGKLYFDKLLNDWLEFDFGQQWTKYDKMVGAGLAILGSRKALPKKNIQKSFDFFPVYHNGRQVNPSDLKQNNGPQEGWRVRDM